MTCPGTLYVDEDGGLRLELIGGFDTRIREPLATGTGYAVSVESRELPMIHGVSGSQRFTLMESQETHSSGGLLSTSIVEQDLSVTRALRGIHLLDPSEPVFLSAHVEFEYLLQWSNRSALELRLTVDDQGSSTGDRWVGTHKVPAVSASYEGLQIDLRVYNTSFDMKNSPVSNQRSIESVERALLEFKPAHPISYDALDVIDKDIQDLLTLSAYTPCASERQGLTYRPSDIHPGSAKYLKDVELLGRQIYLPRVDQSPKSYHRYLFTLADLDFPELVPRWLALKEKARVGCNVLFGLRYIRGGYIATRLLGVASAAESIHRSLRPTNTPLPSAQYRAVKSKLLEAVADESEDVRDFVKHGLLNYPTYYDRLCELAAIPDQEAVDRLLTDRSAWARMLKIARNDLAHANDRSAQDTDATPAFWLLEVTFALLCLVLMAELGMSAETQRAALDHPRISWAAREFRKTLGSFDAPSARTV